MAKTFHPGQLPSVLLGAVVSVATACSTGNLRPDVDEELPTPGPGQTELARVRAIQLSSDAPPLDTFIGTIEAPQIASLGFAEGTPALVVSPGTYTVSVTAEGAAQTSAFVSQPDVPFPAGSLTTLVMYDELASLKLGRIDETNLEAPGADRVRLLVQNAARNLGSVSIEVGGSSDALNLALGEVSGPRFLAPGAAFADVTIGEAGTLRFALPATQGGESYLLFVTRDAADALVLVMLSEDGETQVIADQGPPPPPPEVRVFHGAEEAVGPIDVRLAADGDPLLAGLLSGETSDYVTTRAGSVAPFVTQANNATPIAQLPAFDLLDSARLTWVVYGTSGALSLLSIDDASPIDVDETAYRARFVHIAPGAGPVQLFRVGEGMTATETLGAAFAYGSASEALSLTRGGERIGIDSDGDDIPDLFFPLPAEAEDDNVLYFISADAVIPGDIALGIARGANAGSVPHDPNT